MSWSTDTSLNSPLANAWHLFRHELLYVLWALMEIAIIAPVSLALMPWAGYWSPAQFVLWLLLLVMIPFNLSRLASILEIPVQRQQIIMVLALFITVLAAWRIIVYPDAGMLDFGWLSEMFRHIIESGNPYRSQELAIFVLVVIGWWRGISLVGRRVDFRDTGLRFRMGILLTALLVAFVAGSFLDWSVTPFVLLFFFSGLLAVVMSRVEQLELSRSGRSFPMGPRWLIVVSLTAAILVFLTGIVTGFISGESVLEVVGWMAPVWGGLTFLIASVTSMVSYLLVPIILALEWILGKIPFDFTTPSEMVSDFGEDSGLATVQPEQIVEKVPQFVDTAQRLLPFLIMIFVVLLVSLALSRLFQMARRAAEPEGQPLNPLDGLSGLEKPGFAQRLLDRLGFVRRWRSAASIRRIYQAMCDTAADYGYARASSQTPYEYLTTLDGAWPNFHGETVLITEAYIRVRYGEIPESQEEMNQITEAWEVLRQNLPAGAEADKSTIDIKRLP